jgi:pimeloyl-ACP methyl ester carboxylesterase
MRWILLVTLVAAAVLGWAWASGRLGRLVLAVRILDELRRPGVESLLRRATRAPEKRALVLEARGLRFAADLYRPAGATAAPALILVPGALAEGKDDPRVAPFATLLARAGFPVVLPELPSFRTLRAVPENERELAAVVEAVAARRDLAPRGRVGVFGISYAGGVALCVALDPVLAARVQLVATVGAYADLDSVARYLATGIIHHGDQTLHLEPDPYAQMMFVETYQEFLPSAADHAVFGEMERRRWLDAAASLDDLAERLSHEARLVYDLFEHAPADQVPGMMERLAGGMKRRMAELSPARRDFRALRARLYLVHDRNDRTIPFTETLRLAERARGHTAAHVALLTTLHHVDPERWARDPRQLIGRQLPDAWALGWWWYHLLGERGA